VPSTSFDSWFQRLHPDIPVSGALAILRLAGEGATVPFLARYRKEQTGNLDEVKIRKVLEAKERFDVIVSRQAFILETIDKQKKLTPELKERILATFDPDVLEDLYLPYKQKRETKAARARDAGLLPLADWIWDCGHGDKTPEPGQTLELWAFTFRNAEKGFADADAAIQGAQDILTERVSEVPELRQRVRSAFFERGFVHSTKGEKPKQPSKYERYFDHHEKVKTLMKAGSSHRYLAMRRGAAEGELRLSVGGPPADAAFEQALAAAFEAAACTVEDSPGAGVLSRAARSALFDYVRPSIENEVHRALKAAADEAAIAVFAENLRKLLLAPPFGPKGTLGVDPGVRTGCKAAVVDATGKHVTSAVLHLESDNGRAEAKKQLDELLAATDVRAIAVGNGTAGRETEVFLRKSVHELQRKTPVVMVSEAGASVYSASEAAREEFPDLDVTVRGAISIARRLQDPLAELVKTDPKSIGVGQYQHDVTGKLLRESLEQVVDSCVNQVGVNLNTASYHLLAHVAGIGPALAKAVVEHRQSQGLFRSRAQLLKVPRFSKKTFEQSAGFLRIPDAEHPLDNTAVHPERYAALQSSAQRLGKRLEELLGSGVEAVKGDPALRDEVGSFTFDDIVRELEKPGRDPRDSFVPFEYREDVHELKDLKPGMVCPGIVTNVTNFGAFVDIGVHHDGLVHVSQISDRFVKEAKEVVHPGMRVSVRVLAVDLEKQQISLSMKSEPKPRAEARRRPESRGHKPQAASRRPTERRPGQAPPRETPQTGDAAAAAAGGAEKPAAPAAAADRTARPSRKPEDRRRDRRGPPRDKPPSRDKTQPPAPRRPAHVPLNNPFAVLADLKKTLKPRGGSGS
jgi:uncharacterized protein